MQGARPLTVEGCDVRNLGSMSPQTERTSPDAIPVATIVGADSGRHGFRLGSRPGTKDSMKLGVVSLPAPNLPPPGHLGNRSGTAKRNGRSRPLVEAVHSDPVVVTTTTTSATKKISPSSNADVTSVPLVAAIDGSVAGGDRAVKNSVTPEHKPKFSVSEKTSTSLKNKAGTIDITRFQIPLAHLPVSPAKHHYNPADSPRLTGGHGTSTQKHVFVDDQGIPVQDMDEPKPAGVVGNTTALHSQQQKHAHSPPKQAPLRIRGGRTGKSRENVTNSGSQITQDHGSGAVTPWMNQTIEEDSHLWTAITTSETVTNPKATKSQHLKQKASILSKKRESGTGRGIFMTASEVVTTGRPNKPAVQANKSRRPAQPPPYSPLAPARDENAPATPFPKTVAKYLASYPAGRNPSVPARLQHHPHISARGRFARNKVLQTAIDATIAKHTQERENLLVSPIKHSSCAHYPGIPWGNEKMKESASSKRTTTKQNGDTSTPEGKLDDKTPSFLTAIEEAEVKTNQMHLKLWEYFTPKASFEHWQKAEPYFSEQAALPDVTMERVLTMKQINSMREPFMLQLQKQQFSYCGKNAANRKVAGSGKLGFNKRDAGESEMDSFFRLPCTTDPPSDAAVLQSLQSARIRDLTKQSEHLGPDIQAYCDNAEKTALERTDRSKFNFSCNKDTKLKAKAIPEPPKDWTHQQRDQLEHNGQLRLMTHIFGEYLPNKTTKRQLGVRYGVHSMHPNEATVQNEQRKIQQLLRKRTKIQMKWVGEMFAADTTPTETFEKAHDSLYKTHHKRLERPQDLVDREQRRQKKLAEDRAIRNVRAILHTTFSTEEEASPEQSATSGKNDKPTKLSLPSSSSTLGFLQSKQHDSRTVVFTDNGLGKKGGALSVRGTRDTRRKVELQWTPQMHSNWLPRGSAPLSMGVLGRQAESNLRPAKPKAVDVRKRKKKSDSQISPDARSSEHVEVSESISAPQESKNDTFSATGFLENNAFSQSLTQLKVDFDAGAVAHTDTTQGLKLQCQKTTAVAGLLADSSKQRSMAADQFHDSLSRSKLSGKIISDVSTKSEPKPAHKLPENFFDDPEELQ